MGRLRAQSSCPIGSGTGGAFDILSSVGTLVSSVERLEMETGEESFVAPWKMLVFRLVPPAVPAISLSLRRKLRPLLVGFPDLSAMLFQLPVQLPEPSPSRLVSPVSAVEDLDVPEDAEAVPPHRPADVQGRHSDRAQYFRGPRARFRGAGSAANLFAVYVSQPAAGKRSTPDEREAARRSGRSGLPMKHALSDRAARANTPWRNHIARVWAQGHDPPSSKDRWVCSSWSALSQEASACPEDACIAFVRFGREVDGSISMADARISSISDLTAEEKGYLADWRCRRGTEGISPAATEITALSDISAEERAYLESTLPRKDEEEEDPHDSSVRANLTADQQGRLDAIRAKHAALFTKQTHFDDSAGRPPEYALPIRLHDEQASTARRGARKLTPLDFEELKKQIGILLRAGMIEYSDSAFGAPVLFVAKKGGARRFAVDFR